MKCDEVEELLDDYLLDVLAADDHRAVIDHLAGCPRHSEVEGLRGAASSLALAVPEREPPPTLRSRILGEIAVRAVESAPLPPGEAEARPPLPFPFRSWRRAAYAAAAVLLVALAGTGIWRITAGQDPDGAIVRTLVTPSQSARLVYVPSEQVAVLSVEGLAPSPPDRVYQVWVIRGLSSPVSVGLLPVGPDGSGRIAVNGPLAKGDVVAITIEPAGGSEQPTSAPFLSTKM